MELGVAMFILGLVAATIGFQIKLKELQEEAYGVLRDMIAAYRDQVECMWDDHAIMRIINDLRSPEGDTLCIFCDNPEFHGPNAAVECCCEWTGWNEERFTGKNLYEALFTARDTRDMRRANPALIPAHIPFPG